MFQPKDIYSSNNQMIQKTKDLSSVPPQTQNYQRYSLEINKSKALRMQEIFVEQDCSGKITAASYDSGAMVRRLETYTMVRAANDTLWMGDRFGAWHPID